MLKTVLLQTGMIIQPETTYTIIGMPHTFSVKQRLSIGLWILTMIALPVLRWEFGDDAVPLAVVVALVAKCLAVAVILIEALGFSRTARLFLVVGVLSWVAEFVGSQTGFPFGAYEYTGLLQPQFGHVPLIIPLAWFAMLPVSWAVAQILTNGTLLIYSMVSAIAMTAWDLFLDPQMVGWDFWIWQDDGLYFGIPLTNYVGWLLVAFVVTLVAQPYRCRLPVRPLLTIYGVVCILQTIGQALFWDQPGPALVGGLTMGSILFLSISRQLSMRDQHAAT